MIGWKAFSYLKAQPKAEAAKAWVCPMRCLNRVYAHPGDCDVCHMKLKSLEQKTLKSLGFICPLHRSKKVFDKAGPCPFCGLNLKEHFDGPREPQIIGGLGVQWPQFEGRAAPYLRSYVVREIDVEILIRASGKLQGREMQFEVNRPLRHQLKLGGSAMVMPPGYFARPVQAVISQLGPGKKVRLNLVRSLPGVGWGLAELRVASTPQLAVPLTALLEADEHSQVFVLNQSGFAPRSVTVTLRGESYAAVQGLKLGESVAGSGVFWLDAQWRMEHP